MMEILKEIKEKSKRSGSNMKSLIANAAQNPANLEELINLGFIIIKHKYSIFEHIILEPSLEKHLDDFDNYEELKYMWNSHKELFSRKIQDFLVQGNEIFGSLNSHVEIY